MEKTDIYIKDEGYMHVRVHRNLKAQKFCTSLGISNDLTGDTYGGNPVWKPSCKDDNAMFSFAMKKSMHNEFIKACEGAGLIVESEFKRR
jgi:hypothetical protein